MIQFRNLVSPFPNLRVLQPNIRFFVENGITSVFEQGLATLHGEFAELRGYLIAKLLWDPDANVDSLMTDFLQGYYGDAAAPIRRYIDTMHDALAASGEGLDIYGYPLPSQDGYLSAARMGTYRACFDEAEAAVAGAPELLNRVRPRGCRSSSPNSSRRRCSVRRRAAHSWSAGTAGPPRGRDWIRC